MMKSLLWCVLFSFSFLTSGQLQAQSRLPMHSNFKEVQDLQKLGSLSKQQQLPIMLMFGAQWCEYCELLIEEVLEPMATGDLYDGKVMLMRHVGIDEPKAIPDWSGNMIQRSKWAYQLNADLTPTILFFDGSGNEVAPRIVGVAEITLYTELIHQNLNIAYKKMGLSKQIPATPERLEIQVNQAKQNKIN